jgi:hypothetical protein
VVGTRLYRIQAGLEVDNETPQSVEGPWVDRDVGRGGIRVDIIYVRTPDGHGRLELTKFHSLTAVSLGRLRRTRSGFRRIMFANDDIDQVVARVHVHGA